jgi:rod shape-determining protein MreC
MQRLFHIVREFKEYFILSAFVVVSISLLSQNDNPQVHQLRGFALGVVGRIQEVVSLVPNIFQLKAENAILRRRNVDLADEVSRLREAKLENIRLRRLLEFKESVPYRLVPAKVIGKTLHLQRNTITLNVGENDGVRTGMPMVTDAGLVGKVIATSEQYAIGQVVLNRDFRVSAKVQRSRVDGILSWEGGRYSLLKNVPKTQDVKVGDMIETSEYSNTYPPHIRIGVVASVKEQPGSLFYTVEVENAVDLSTLEEAFVVKFLPDSARTRFEEKVLR